MKKRIRKKIFKKNLDMSKYTVHHYENVSDEELKKVIISNWEFFESIQSKNGIENAKKNSMNLLKEFLMISEND